MIHLSQGLLPGSGAARVKARLLPALFSAAGIAGTHSTRGALLWGRQPHPHPHPVSNHNGTGSGPICTLLYGALLLPHSPWIVPPAEHEWKSGSASESEAVSST